MPGIGVGKLQAQTASAYAMDCIALSDLQNSHMVPRLARSVRDCIDQGRYDDAIQVFFAYVIFGDFDRLHVKMERQNGAVVHLHNWILADFPRPVLNMLRTRARAMHDPKSEIFAETCARLIAIGPPSYQPYYLIGRGVERELKAENWQVDQFDAVAVWTGRLGVNGCRFE